jgi:hypothetical protein
LIGNAVLVMKILTGEVADNQREVSKEYARKGGLIGGRKREAKLVKGRRSEIELPQPGRDGAKRNSLAVLVFYTQM